MAQRNQIRGNTIIPLTDHFGFGLPGADGSLDDSTGARIIAVNGAPGGVITAPKGSLALDYGTPALWVNTDGATGWAVAGNGPGELLSWDREVPVTGQGGNTRTTDWRPPRDVTISAIHLYALTAPTTVGTYTFAAAGDGNNLLSAATFDLTSLVNDTLTAMTLTLTTADLNIDALDLVRFTFASNNPDLAGSGILLVVEWYGR